MRFKRYAYHGDDTNNNVRLRFQPLLLTNLEPVIASDQSKQAL